MKKIFQEKKSNDFLKMLLESIGEGVFALDTLGYIISWNPAMEHITGYLEKEVIGKSCRMLGFNKCFGKKCPGDPVECGVLKRGKVDPVANAIHSASMRKDVLMVTVNCSALSESLLESELFGHIHGAFTGAIRDRVGRFEEADAGTVFLDEIGEISSYIQLKLLRVLQQREIERVGESRKRKVNIRIIAATNKNLYDLVQKGFFREDLYYRLKVFPVYLPPLRKRKEDIPLLVNYFIHMHNKITGKQIQGVLHPVMRIFMDHSWPGNVRELGNAIEHAFVLCNAEQIDVPDLPVEMRQTGYHPAFFESDKTAGKAFLHRKKLDQETLLHLLNECDWNKAEVARRVGLSRASIWKYMKKWGIPQKQLL